MWERIRPSTVESRASSDYVSPPRRLAAFLRDFLPEQKLQLLFPLGSLLLLVGASHWWFELELPHITEPFGSQMSADWGLMNRLTHSIVVWVSVEEQITHVLVRFGFLASLVL